MASADGAGVEFSGSDRERLLQELSDALSTKVSPVVWACLWLSDIEQLETLRNGASLATGPMTSPWAGFQFIGSGAGIVQAWTQRKRSASTSSTPQKQDGSKQSTPRRSKAPRDQAFRRDQEKCVLTKFGHAAVAHIYPFSMRDETKPSSPQVLSFWSILKVFWSEERVDAWYNAIFEGGGTEVCQNLICLAPNAHACWTKACFVLKPLRLSDDKKCLDVQFFWLSSGASFHNNSEIDIMHTPSLPNTDHGPTSEILFNQETRKVICSGDKFTLETDDPESRPLPDYSLLEMQWFLHRVAAMSGAAEAQDDMYDSDGDEVLMDWESQEAWVDDLETATERS